MSTLKVSEIRNASSATGGLSIAADGVVSGALPYPNRNLLYNGAMQVAQRGTSSTGITSNGYYTADRWNLLINAIGTWTQTVEADGPTGSGLAKSLKMLCTTSEASPGSGAYYAVRQILEGQDVQRIAKGTASAQQLTLSFWVKSNVTGTYIVQLKDVDNTRSISASYTISASGTWEYKTLTVTADASGGVLDNDSDGSLQVRWWLGAGSNYTSGSLQTSWGAEVNADIAPGQTNLAAATNNYWQVTGVQLEVGDTATEFEHLPFGVEFARCQRYYEKSNNYGTAVFTANTAGEIPTNLYNNIAASDYYWTVNFKVAKRTSPTITTYPYTTPSNTGRWSNDVGTDYAAGSAAALVVDRGFFVRNDSGGTLTVGGQQIILGNWIADAEL